MGLAPPLWAQTPEFQWLAQYGTFGDQSESITAVSTDVSGNVYAAGQTFGNLGGLNQGAGDIFIRKYSPSGVLLGTRQLGTIGNDDAAAVFVDSTGVYIAGSTGGDLDGAGPQTNAGASDGYVLRMNLDLTGPTWIRQFGSPAFDVVRGIAGDGVALYAAGDTTGTLPGEASSGLGDVFLIALSRDGMVVWTRQFGTPAADQGFGVAVHDAGVYVAGTTNSAFPGQTPGGSSDAFVRKYAFDGSVAWTRQFGGLGFDTAIGVSADGSGVYVAGIDPIPNPNAYVRKLSHADGTDIWYTVSPLSTAEVDEARAVVARDSAVIVGGRTFGDLFAANAGIGDVFVASLDASTGGLNWGRQFGSALADHSNAVAADNSGTAIVAGQADALLPGAHPEGLVRGTDGFVLKVGASDGTTIWANQFGSAGPATDLARAVSSGLNGVFAVGDVGGPLPGQAHSGLGDAYLRKFDAGTGEVEATTQFGTPAADVASAIYVDPARGIYVAGRTFGALPGQINAGGGLDPFVARFNFDGTLDRLLQFGTAATDQANGIAGDDTGIYVVGIRGLGTADIFVTKFDFDLTSTPLFTAVMGSTDSSGNVRVDFGNAISAGTNGLYIVGQIFGEVFGGLPPAGPVGQPDAFVRRLDPSDGSEVWTRAIRTSGVDAASGIIQDDTGIYVVGTVQGQLPGQPPPSGPADAFAQKLDFNGNVVQTQVIQSPSGDNAFAIASDSSGVYVAGFTGAALPGQSSAGVNDAYVVKYTQDLVELWTLQFGSLQNDSVSGISAGSLGLVLAGVTAGTLPGQINAGASDAFVARMIQVAFTLNGANPMTIERGTDFQDPGAAAMDAPDRELAGATIDVTGSVNSSVVGSYELTYTLTYNTIDGPQTKTLTRTVNVVDSTAQLIVNLIATTTQIGFQQGTALLQNVASSIARGSLTAACDQLSAFINQVEAQTGKQVTVSQAASLMTDAEDLRAALGCR